MEHKLTIKEASDKTGVSPSWMSHIENDKPTADHKTITLSVPILEKLLAMYDMTLLIVKEPLPWAMITLPPACSYFHCGGGENCGVWRPQDLKWYDDTWVCPNCFRSDGEPGPTLHEEIKRRSNKMSAYIARNNEGYITPIYAPLSEMDLDAENGND